MFRFFVHHSCTEAFGFDLDFARKMHKYNTIDNDIDFAKLIAKPILHKYRIAYSSIQDRQLNVFI